MGAFEWLNDIIRAVLLVFPRIVIVRATHGGIKWRHGKTVIAILPGLCIYWPFVSEVEIIPTARQTTNLVAQVLRSKDGITVGISAIVVHEVSDIALAIGHRNVDLSDTVCDMSLGAIAEIVGGTEMIDLTVEKLNSRITAAAKRSLKPYGVAVHSVKITDLADCFVFRMIA